LQYKSFGGIELKADIDKNIIEGYASTFGNIDSDGDYFEPSAWNKSINDWKGCAPKKRRVKVLWHHDRKEPIGIPMEMVADEKGLYTVSKISKTMAGEKVLILARDGVLNEMSVGFRTIQDKFDETRKANAIKEAMLWEYSPVTWGSSAETTIDDVKHLLGEYQYSKGNVMDIVAMELLKSIKALVKGDEPSNDTLTDKKSQDINEIMAEIKKYL